MCGRRTRIHSLELNPCRPNTIGYQFSSHSFTTTLLSKPKTLRDKNLYQYQFPSIGYEDLSLKTRQERRIFETHVQFLECLKIYAAANHWTQLVGIADTLGDLSIGRFHRLLSLAFSMFDH
ncbi:hypothetical protein H5410_061159 [Solanum commersonii]|uniref:Uncharacterized protein n=1 Tax=Solanum commersonii TaxID=4109 RepID=A0A9J5W7D3_SOLCO|nr:hypothetical protein H5410_061159 [Solanum commersonii]